MKTSLFCIRLINIHIDDTSRLNVDNVTLGELRVFSCKVSKISFTYEKHLSYRSQAVVQICSIRLFYIYNSNTHIYNPHFDSF